MKDLRRSLALLIAVLAFASVACGSPSEGTAASGHGDSGSPATSDPESPVSSSPDDGEPVPGPGASPVEPQPGQVDVRPVRWESAKPLGDSSVKVKFWSGVEPCNVLDRVETEYAPKAVTITLYEGHSPTEEEVACIELALMKQTTVELEEPLGGRTIIDGAR